jgi:membrane-bound lytic murein transglycosylase A
MHPIARYRTVRFLPSQALIGALLIAASVAPASAQIKKVSSAILSSASCPPPPASAPKAPPSPETPALPEQLRGTLQASTWEALQGTGWANENHTPALEAFLQSCNALKEQPSWNVACEAANQLTQKNDATAVSRFFEAHFVPHQVVNGDGSTSGTITGYYEPLLNGSRTPTERYRYPLYTPPDDMITVDLAEVHPDLKHKRLRGKVVGNKLVPYLTRGEIEADSGPLKGRELVYVDDPIESFFLHIQGSGQVKFEDGTSMRVGYADQNGHPFRGLARALMRNGEIGMESASMQGMKLWAQKNPGKVQAYMNCNPSYVFFKELAGDLSGPIGTLGVPLTAERSLAVDQRVVPLGVPVFLSTTFPGSKKPLNRLMLAQDTGGAINGGVRADFFWGFGDKAGEQAGMMKQSGKMWVLLPKGYTPQIANSAAQ